MTDAPSRARRMRENLTERRERHLRRGRLHRILFVIAGIIVTLAGLAMLVTPGPAFVIIPIGLAMLALEFKWADNIQQTGEWSDFTLNGDSAPNDRFNYRAELE